MGTVLDLVRYLDRQGTTLAGGLPGEGLGVIAARAGDLGLPPASGRSNCGGATRFVEAGDGWMAVSLSRPEDVELVPAWLEIAEPSAADLWVVVAAAVADRPVAEVVDRAAMLGIACSRVGEMSDGRAVLVDRLGDAPPRPLGEMTVVNLGSLWAAPLAGDLLARLGAKVIKVESTTRPDGARATPRHYAALNHRSLSVALPLATAAGAEQLAALIARADVVIEASRPRALRRLGIDASGAIRTGPAIWVSITSHGRDDAVAHRVGFGDDAAAAGGLVGWVAGPDGRAEPRFVADAVADPLTGLTAAATVCQLAATGGRWLADVALARVAAAACGGTGDWLPIASEPAQVPTPTPRSTDEPRGSIPLGRDTATVLDSLGIGT